MLSLLCTMAVVAAHERVGAGGEVQKWTLPVASQPPGLIVRAHLGSLVTDRTRGSGSCPFLGHHSVDGSRCEPVSIRDVTQKVVGAELSERIETSDYHGITASTLEASRGSLAPYRLRLTMIAYLSSISRDLRRVFSSTPVTSRLAGSIP
jgi:hypothetical protein